MSDTSDFKRVIVINTGWSDDYQTGEVIGAFGYLANGVGHERFNFLPVDGRYYGYSPPLGEAKSPPMPKVAGGWLVFFVSKRPGRSGLYLVGWYENARFIMGTDARPDADILGPDTDGGKFSYTVTADRAVLVPLASRTMKFRGDHIKRSFAYLRGNGDTEKWREPLAQTLLGFRDKALASLANQAKGDDSFEVTYCRDAKRRKLIEDSAVNAVKQHFSDWECESKEKDKTCGYDLRFTKKTGEEMHVEVKGTSGDQPNFFITKNELNCAEKLSVNDKRARRNRDGSWRPIWKLAVVHDALEAAHVNIYSHAEAIRKFNIDPIAWRGILKDPI